VTDTRDQYLSAARTALALLEDDAVARAWTEPSALEGFTVGGLAAHLANQIVSVATALDTDLAGKPTVALLDHYGRAAWLAADIDNEVNMAIRAGSEHRAGPGPATVLADTRAALARLDADLAGLDVAAPRTNPHWAYAMRLDDLLRTRIMEFVVHADDLAHSVGIATPGFDADAFDTAVWILTRLAAARHGQAALIRALARSERAPATISGL
jgi:uncharacterized protein (TIGR03083 family)